MKSLSKREDAYSIKNGPELRTRRGCHSLVSTDSGCIYAIGGLNFSEKVMKRCEKYILALNEWVPIPKLNIARKNHSSCSIGEYIYVIGGETNDFG